MAIAEFLLVVSSITFQDTTVNKPVMPDKKTTVSQLTVNKNETGRTQSTKTNTKAERAAAVGRVKRGGWDHN